MDASRFCPPLVPIPTAGGFARTPVPMRRRTIMRIRTGATLLFALTALLGAAQAASASHCGFFRFSSCRDACCDVQNCYSSCQTQNRVCYKLVYDCVEE